MSRPLADWLDRPDMTKRGYDAGEHGRCCVLAQHVVADDGLAIPREVRHLV